MYQRILVPLDGSDTSTLGLQEACKLARESHAAIRLIHVVDELIMASPHIYGAALVTLTAQLRSAGESILANAKALVEKAQVPVDAKLVEVLGGRAGEQIVKAAQEWPADLIVCGTYNSCGWYPTFLPRRSVSL